MSLKLKRRADLSLSINAIVVLILAITMLGLGLGFMRNIFGQATEEFTRVGGTVQKQMIDQMRESQRTVDISRPKLVIKQGGKDQVFLGFKNDQSANANFEIASISGEALASTGTVTSSLKCDQNPPASTDIHVLLSYRKGDIEVEKGEVVVLPLNIKVMPNSPEGTCFFNMKVTSSAGTTSTDRYIELTVDVTP